VSVFGQEVVDDEHAHGRDALLDALEAAERALVEGERERLGLINDGRLVGVLNGHPFCFASPSPFGAR
jgi:hypothetical protein